MSDRDDVGHEDEAADEGRAPKRCSSLNHEAKSRRGNHRLKNAMLRDRQSYPTTEQRTPRTDLDNAA